MMKRKKNLVEDNDTLIALSDQPEQTYGSMEVLVFPVILVWKKKMQLVYKNHQWSQREEAN